jgi:hypothetical protein
MAFSQKGALKEGRPTIVFCDQSGFYLLAMVVRTYAPVGKTPVVREHLSRDHLSAMNAITLDEGKLYMIEQERAFKGEDVVRFLPEAPDGPDRGQALDHLGWFSDSPLSGAQGLPGERGGLPNTTGAVAQLRTRAQPRRRGLEISQMRGVEEPLLPEYLGVESRATQGQRAFETQEARHFRLHQTAGLRGLDVCADSDIRA